MLQRWSNYTTKALHTLFRRGAFFVVAALMAVTVTISPLATRPANAQLQDLLSLGGSFTNTFSSCAIETVGWVICPTMRSIAKFADYGFTYVNQSFLKIDYNIAANNSGTYVAWELMRNIANALFVVAFMILIYSQLTGRGGGYNVKRMVPKLLVSAILVNVSYFICVGAIDVANILGDSILGVLVGVASKVGHSIMPVGAAANGFQDGTLTVITASVMSKAGYAWVLLAPVAAVTISVATICAAAVVILIMRKTVVAMLILMSPILFVAYLLPNLERFFFQGVRLFAQLLLLYPIVALLLGAGQIVSATIVTVGSGDTNYRVSGDSYFSINGGSGSSITDLTAAAAAVLPLLGVWFVFKNMSSIMSTAGARLSASVAGRRGKEGDEKAKVTGNATAGAQNRKNFGGFGQRRQAFTRHRRPASLGASSLTGEDGLGRAGSARPNPLAGKNALESSIKGEGEDTKRQLEELQNAKLDAQADELGVDGAIANAAGAIVGGGKGGKGDDKQLTAKDIFNNMNQSHQSKDKGAKSGGGPAPAGTGQVTGNAQPATPGASYRAPEMAQSGNIVSGSAASQPIKVVAVPVQIDTSSLLQNQNRPPVNVDQTPVSGTAEKAKARAQKYLFEADNDLEEARDGVEDILGRNFTGGPTEAPHTKAPEHKGKDDE